MVCCPLVSNFLSITRKMLHLANMYPLVSSSISLLLIKAHLGRGYSLQTCKPLVSSSPSLYVILFSHKHDQMFTWLKFHHNMLLTALIYRSMGSSFSPSVLTRYHQMCKGGWYGNMMWIALKCISSQTYCLSSLNLHVCCHTFSSILHSLLVDNSNSTQMMFHLMVLKVLAFLRLTGTKSYQWN